MAVELRWLLLLAACFSVQALVGRCGHAEMQADSVPSRSLVRAAPSSYMSAYGRGAEWEPFRIKLYYGLISLTVEMQQRFDGAIGGMKNWLENSLRVKRVTQTWKLEGIKICSGVTLSGPILTETFDADFVLFVTADMVPSGVGGSASYCQTDSQTGQPVLGVFYFNGFAHVSEPDEQILATILHEVTHALAFSRSLFTRFLKPNGKKYTKEELYLTEILRGYQVQKLILPTVVKRARDAFDCPSLNGVELEADGGAGTAGSHWEKRIMYTDYMVADSYVKDVIYSDISLAVFEDSGWYRVNYRYSNQVQWGYLHGCSFLSEKCVLNGLPLSPEFCTTARKDSCDFTGLRKSKCDLMRRVKAPPSQYQYFSDLTLGGTDVFLDYCPVFKPSKNADCRDQKTAVRSGETVGLSSRCFEWTDLRPQLRDLVGCFAINCETVPPSVSVANVTVQCPLAGGLVEVQDFGFLNCPPVSQLCGNVPCVNNCYGGGYCLNGWCVCDNGTDKCNSEY